MPATEAQCRICGASVAAQAWAPGTNPAAAVYGAPSQPIPAYAGPAASGIAPPTPPVGYAAPPPGYPPPPTYGSQPYVVPGYGAPAYGPPKKKRTGLIIGVVVGVLAVFGVIFGTCGALVFSAGKEVAGARSAGQSIANAVLAGDTSGTWLQLHPSLQSEAGQGGWAELVDGIKSPGATVSFSNVHVSSGTGGTTAELSGPINNFKHRDGQMEMVLRKEGGRWLVQGLHWQADRPG